MEFLHQLIFASDALWFTLLGAACWVGAGLCLLFEQLRIRRRKVERLEQVGWMPWTNLFMALAIIGGGFLAMSLPVVLGSL